MNDIQREMICNLKDKNRLLAVVQSTKASLHNVTMRATGLEEERQKLLLEIQLRRSRPSHSHIDDDKEEIDAYISHLDQRVNQLNSEILDSRAREERYKKELEEKESELSEVESKFESLEKSYAQILDGKGITRPFIIT